MPPTTRSMPAPKAPRWPTEGQSDRPAPPSTLTGAYPGQRAIRKKPISLPPPGELTQHAEEDRLAAEMRAARRAGSKKKSRETPKGRKDSVVSKTGGKPKKQVKQRSGLTYDLEMQSERAGWNGIEFIPFTDRFVSKKVLRFRQQQDDRVDEKMTVVEKKEGEKKTFRFMEVPDLVKTRIYRLVAVDLRSCVWPTLLLGGEQPDLSMVCREIRAAVLPIYYSENIFAVDIAPPAVDESRIQRKSGQAPKRQAVSGLVALQKWAETLSDKQNEGGKWFHTVKNWCFSYQDPKFGFQGSKAAPGVGNADRSFVASLRFPNIQLKEGEEGIVDCEVHRQAACVMPGWAEYKQCAYKWAPKTLCHAITTWLQTHTGDPQGLANLVLEMRKLLDELSDPAHRCDTVVKSIEMDNGTKEGPERLVQ